MSVNTKEPNVHAQKIFEEITRHPEDVKIREKKIIGFVIEKDWRFLTPSDIALLKEEFPTEKAMKERAMQLVSVMPATKKDVDGKIITIYESSDPLVKSEREKYENALNLLIKTVYE